ncbi:MAG: hypothetical protein H7A38_03125 [Chlamydiales bacterium]|nr:hypothetical protein [Chlamydiales bacterium]
MVDIIPPPSVNPPTGPQFTPSFDYTGGSYTPRPDTLSSMSDFAKKNAKPLAIGALLLGLVYALWSFLTRQSPSTKDDDDSSQHKGSGVTSTTSSSKQTPVKTESKDIIGKKDVDWKSFANRFGMLYRVLNMPSCKDFTASQLTTAMLNDLNASESFKKRIRDDREVDAFREFVQALLPHIIAEGTPLAEMPAKAYTLDSDGKYLIVKKFEEVTKKK